MFMADSPLSGLAPASTLGERYAIVAEEGQGGSATVYRALDMQSHQEVAVKHLNIDHLPAADQSHRIQRFQNEASILTLLQHEYIMRIHDNLEIEQQHYMTLEWLKGEPLDQFAARHQRHPEKILPLMLQLCEALEYIHARGIIHRDLKPENILVTPEGKIKVLDFGIARMQGMDLSNEQGALVGTVAYMSPEQLQNARLTHAQSDIYSLGILMYELFTGRLPFQASDHGSAILMVMNQKPVAPVQLNHLIGADLNHLILTCINKEPQHRFNSARQLQKLLNVLVQRVFYPGASPSGFAQAVLPAIRPFDDFGLLQGIEALVDKHANGQCLIWSTFEEGGIWLQNGNVLHADVKNKKMSAEEAFFEILSWQSGNLIYIPKSTMPTGGGIQKNSYKLLEQAEEYLRDYIILWEMYQKDDIPEITVFPGIGEKLSEEVWALLEFLDGQTCVGQLISYLPYPRMQIMKALQNLEDRQFLFMDRRR